MPIFFISTITIYSATPVFFNTAPKADPKRIINPINAKKDPNASAITPPIDKRGCLVIIALRITQITTLSIAFISLNANMI